MTIAELRAAGYAIEYDSRTYKVALDGKIVGQGGRDGYHNGTPFETRNWTWIHMQCAIWVAQRHHNAENHARGARAKLAEDVHRRGAAEGRRAARAERGAGDEVRLVPRLTLGAW